MSTRTRFPDIEELLAQSDDREAYISFCELMNGLWAHKFEDRANQGDIEEMREVAISVVTNLLFNDGFFDVMEMRGVIPFYYQPPGAGEPCQKLYIHKDELMEALCNKEFLYNVLHFEFMTDEINRKSMETAEALWKFIGRMSDTGKTKLQEQSLTPIKNAFYERRARPMVEDMANIAFPLKTSTNFYTSKQFEL